MNLGDGNLKVKILKIENRGGSLRMSLELLLTFIGNNPQLEEIRLSNNSLGTWRSRAIIESLVNLPNLKVLDIAGNTIGTTGMIALNRVLSNHSSIEFINISSNNILDEGLNYFYDTLSELKTLHTLILNNNKLSEHCMEKFSNAISHLPLFHTLFLNNNNIKAQGIYCLCNALKSSNLTSLSLNGNGFEYMGAFELSELIPTVPKLKILNLSGNNVGTEGIIVISKSLAVLEHTSHIQELALSDNCAGLFGTEVFSLAIPKLTSLQSLYFSSNNIGEKGASFIAEKLSKAYSESPQVKFDQLQIRLYLQRKIIQAKPINEIVIPSINWHTLPKSIWDYIREYVPSEGLKQLSLAKNNISSMVFKGDNSLYPNDFTSHLSNIMTLEELTLRDNNLSVIDPKLLQLPLLKNVRITKNPFLFGTNAWSNDEINKRFVNVQRMLLELEGNRLLLPIDQFAV
jgi:Ran GTPase-activating protein (RanGAP) involved in mRNA processing and transport